MGDSSSMPVFSAADTSTTSGPFTRISGSAGKFVQVDYRGADHELTFLLAADGTRVWATWNALVGFEDVTALLLGPILVCVLRLRDITCLHASVVEIDGRALALLGPKGAGKTTTALALVREGGRLISDDVAALEENGTGFLVRPGRCRLRMRAEPAAAFGQEFESLAPLWSRSGDRPQKRLLELPESFLTPDLAPIPLHALYVLGARSAGGTSSITPLPAGSALPMLMAHRHMAEIVERDGHQRDFSRLARLASSQNVSMVERPEGAIFATDVAVAVKTDFVERN